MTINLHLPNKRESMRPMITVIGVGGAGGNAVNNMIAANLEGINFVVANTDAQALDHSLAERTIQLGANITRGLGAGASPDVGRAAAEEAMEEIAASMEGSHMVFITAGMGGGTGTGAAPVVARMARDQGILTVGVVTKPFQFEGTHRMRMAESGLQELQQYVDTLIVIPNQNLFRVANERTTFADAFKMADEVLHSGVRGVTDLIVKPGLVNLDFADIRTVMREMGKAMMGTGEATGDRRAIDAAEAAISNPLLDDVSLKGAKAVLINITGGLDMTLFEVDEAANRIRDEVDTDANIIFGSTFHEAMEGRMRVSVVATGIDAHMAQMPQQTRQQERAPEKKPFSFSGRGEEQKIVKPASPQIPQAPTLRETVREAREVASQRAAQYQPAPQAQPIPRIDLPPVQNDQMFFEEEVRVIEREEAIAKRAPSFVSPQAAQPANRTLFTAAEPASPQAEVREQAAPVASFSPRSGAREVRETRSEEPSGSRNLLQRGMASVGRVLSSSVAKPEMEAPAPRKFSVSEKPRPDVAERPQAQVEEEEFDIPAFLRRQAN